MKPKYRTEHACFFSGDGYRFITRRYEVDIYLCAREKRTGYSGGPRLVWGNGAGGWDGYGDFNYLVSAMECGCVLPGQFNKLLKSRKRDEAKVIDLFRYVIALEQLHS